MRKHLLKKTVITSFLYFIEKKLSFLIEAVVCYLGFEEVKQKT